MNNKTPTIVEILTLVDNNISNVENPEPSHSVLLMTNLYKLEDNVGQLVSKLKTHKFKLTNQDHVDVLELTEKYNAKSLFAYFLANVVKVNTTTTDKLIQLIYSNEQTEQDDAFLIGISEFAKANSLEYNTEFINEFYQKILNKIKIYVDFSFYLFSLNLYQPVADKENYLVFDEYRKWINDTIMQDAKAT